MLRKKNSKITRGQLKVEHGKSMYPTYKWKESTAVKTHQNNVRMPGTSEDDSGWHLISFETVSGCPFVHVTSQPFSVLRSSRAHLYTSEMQSTLSSFWCSCTAYHNQVWGVLWLTVTANNCICLSCWEASCQHCQKKNKFVKYWKCLKFIYDPGADSPSLSLSLLIQKSSHRN